MINPLFHSIIIGINILFIVILSYMVFQKKIRERDSFLWYVLLFILLFFSIVYELVDYVAEKLNIVYPLSLLFLLGILVLLVICFYHSYRISDLNNKLTELAQQLALNNVHYKKGDNSVTKAQKHEEGNN